MLQCSLKAVRSSGFYVQVISGSEKVTCVAVTTMIKIRKILPSNIEKEVLSKNKQGTFQTLDLCKK